VDSGITRKISGFYPDFFRVAPSGASSVFRASVAVVQPFVQPSNTNFDYRISIRLPHRLPHLDSIAAHLNSIAASTLCTPHSAAVRPMPTSPSPSPQDSLTATATRTLPSPVMPRPASPLLLASFVVGPTSIAVIVAVESANSKFVICHFIGAVHEYKFKQ
jgi:hypothetical protein